MSHHLTQGPSHPTRNSQQAGIAERILDFGQHRSPPPTEISTVVQTPAFPVPSTNSEEKFPHTPNPFHLEEDQDFSTSTTIHGPVFQIVHSTGLETHAGIRVWVSWVQVQVSRVRVQFEAPAPNPYPYRGFGGFFIFNLI